MISLCRQAFIQRNEFRTLAIRSHKCLCFVHMQRLGGQNRQQSSEAKAIVKLKDNLTRQFHLDLGHPWIYDDEIANISELGMHEAGTLAEVLDYNGVPRGVGVLNRQASIVVRRMDGIGAANEVTQEVLRSRLRKAFSAREQRHSDSTFCRVVHGEADGLPGIGVDRFGSSVVVIFESVGSARLEFIVEEELTRWLGKLESLVIHRMTSKKEKWAQGGSEFTTSIVRGGESRILVKEKSCSFEFDVHQGVLGHWNYSVESIRNCLVEKLAPGSTTLDIWSQAGQWGIRCADKGAKEVVFLEDSLGFAKLCKDNAERNGVDLQCTVLHRSDVLEELQNMALSGIRFSCVHLNLRVKVEHYFKHRRGQFGRWHKPTLKGYEQAVRSAAQVTSRGGYLVVTFLLPLVEEHTAVSILQGSLERVSRVGSLVFQQTAVDDDIALASSSMDDAWTPVVVCVRLS